MEFNFTFFAKKNKKDIKKIFWEFYKIEVFTGFLLFLNSHYMQLCRRLHINQKIPSQDAILFNIHRNILYDRLAKWYGKIHDVKWLLLTWRMHVQSFIHFKIKKKSICENIGICSYLNDVKSFENWLDTLLLISYTIKYNNTR